jgi:hypothetical protein
MKKTFVIKMSDGQQVRIKASKQLGPQSSPYFVDEAQETVAGFGTVLGWWEETCEVNNTAET